MLTNFWFILAHFRTLPSLPVHFRPGPLWMSFNCMVVFWLGMREWVCARCLCFILKTNRGIILKLSKKLCKPRNCGGFFIVIAALVLIVEIMKAISSVSHRQVAAAEARSYPATGQSLWARLHPHFAFKRSIILFNQGYSGYTPKIMVVSYSTINKQTGKITFTSQTWSRIILDIEMKIRRSTCIILYNSYKSEIWR